MSDLLDLPPIVMPAEAKTDLAPLDLKKIDLTDVALAQYGDWRKEVAATRANLSTLVLDLTTPTKIKDARALRQRLIGDPLAAVRKVSAGIKSKMAQASKAVGAELEKIEAAYTEADALILPQIEAREAVLEAERAEKARLEAERVAKLQAGIATIRGYVQRAAGLPSERIAKGIAGLAAMTFPVEEWAEFAVPAANAQCETLEALRKMHVAALQAEVDKAERERLEAEAAERRAQEPVAAVVKEQPAAHAPPEPAATVTTPGGVVADAHTGEVLHTPEPAAPLAPSNAEKIEQARQIVNDIIAAETVRCRGGQRRRAHHPARAQREAVALTPEQLLRCIRDNVRGDTLRLTRDVGPYEVTTLTFEAQTLFRAVIREFCAANGLAAPKE